MYNNSSTYRTDINYFFSSSHVLLFDMPLKNVHSKILLK